MARFGIVSGLLLCFNTAFALFSSLNKEPLLFIPMMLGIPILFFGVVALNPHRRRQALGTAALVGGAGCLIGTGHLVRFLSDWRNAGVLNLRYAQIVLLMISICLAFLVGYLWNMNRLRRNESKSSRKAEDQSGELT